MASSEAVNGAVIFEADAGFSMDGREVTLEVGSLANETVLGLLAAAHEIAKDRRLKLPVTSGIGSLAVIGTRGQPTDTKPEPSASELLVATLDQSGAWYTKVATDLNEGRAKKQKVQIVPENELPGRAKAWLTNDRLKATEGGGLYYEEDSPLVVMALPNTPVSHEESVQTWANARNGRIWDWGGRLAFLKQWSADQLSGYDPSKAQEPVRFVAIETGYEKLREGTGQDQLEVLERVQSRYPAVRSAAIFEGGVLANRYADEANPNWLHALVRAIELKPDSVGRFPYADVSDGRANVGYSYGLSGAVSRRLVG